MKTIQTQVPSWAKWKAQDSNGFWMAYSLPPDGDKSPDGWVTEWGSMSCAIGLGDPNPNWRDTLEEI